MSISTSVREKKLVLVNYTARIALEVIPVAVLMDLKPGCDEQRAMSVSFLHFCLCNITYVKYFAASLRVTPV